MIAYKLCKKKGNKYHPLYVNTNDEFVLGAKYYSSEGPKTPNGKVKSKLGELSYRPGVHLSMVPIADHIGKRNSDGTLLRRVDTVWLECEVSDEINYTEEARANKYKCLDRIPSNGFYYYNTNSQAKTQWLISDWIIPIRELSREEEIQLCNDAGFEAQQLEIVC